VTKIATVSSAISHSVTRHYVF